MMRLYLKLILFTLITKQLNGFRNDHNVYETFDTNHKIDEQLDENLPQFTTQSKQLYEEGRHRYEVMASEQNLYGKCWRSAIESLHTNCKQLNDEIQSRLSLAFANCFLERSGLKTYPCDTTLDVKECIKDMTDRAFNSYTEFFTHTQSVCFYLQAERWQHNTEQTIDKLTITSVKVSERLADASQQLEQLNGLQEMSIGSQIRLNDELIAARNTMNEFRSSTNEQRFIVKEILDRFIKLQDFVLIEISYGYSLIFLIVSMTVVYLVTTPSRTNEARLWLLIVLLINFFVERIIASYSVDEQLGLKSTSIVINERIWLSRKISLILMTIIFLWFAITYKDYGLVNYNILKQHTMHLNNIQNQLNQLFGNIQSGRQSQSQTIPKDSDNEYSSNSDSDFSGDSDYSTDESDSTNASIETCSTMPIVSSSSVGSCTNADNYCPNSQTENKSLVALNSEESEKRVYNLRPRKSTPLPNNSFLKEESTKEFAFKVKMSEMISQMNHQRVNKTLMNKEFFSSDDD